MRVLVIGRNGQVARSLVERAAPAGAEVTALGRPDLDLADSRSINETIARAACDVIVNAAAYTGVDAAESDADQAYLINAAGAGTIAGAARERDVPLIHISTDYVFDGRKPSPYVETDPVAPMSVYGHSKLAGEEAVRAAHSRHVTLRTAWVFSPFGSNFVKTMLRLAEDRDEIRVVNDQIGSPTSALDLADTILALGGTLPHCEREGFGTFHAAGSGATSWAGLAETVFSASARHGGPVARVVPIPTSAYPTAAARPANSRLDCAKLADIHGIRLRRFEPAVDETVARLLSDPSRTAAASDRRAGRR